MVELLCLDNHVHTLQLHQFARGSGRVLMLELQAQQRITTLQHLSLHLVNPNNNKDENQSVVHLFVEVIKMVAYLKFLDI